MANVTLREFYGMPSVPAPNTNGMENTVAGTQQIEWAPLAGPSRLPFNGTSYQAVRRVMTTMWGKFPIRLSRERGDDETLKAMMITAADGAEPYRILHQAVVQFGEIEVRNS